MKKKLTKIQFQTVVWCCVHCLIFGNTEKRLLWFTTEQEIISQTVHKCGDLYFTCICSIKCISDFNRHKHYYLVVVLTEFMTILRTTQRFLQLYV